MPRPVRELLPTFLEPMLLEAGAPTGWPEGQWAIEVKFDGIRAQPRVDRGDSWSLRLAARPQLHCAVC